MSGHYQTKINVLLMFHAVVNKVHIDYASLVWTDFISQVMQLKQTTIQYTRFTKLIIIDLMEKYPSIAKRLDEEYHTIKDDTPLCNMYATREVTVCAMQILNELMINEIKETQAKPSATRTPNPELAKKKKKGKQIVGESSTPKLSLKIRIKQRKSTPAASLPPVDDDERDDIIEATQLSLAKAKTTKVYGAQQNVALVVNRILEEDVEKLVEGDDESGGDEFANTMILSDEDFGNRIEPGSHKENLEEIVDDDDKIDDDKHDDAKIDEDKDDDDDDDHTDHALVRNHRTSSLETRTKKMQTLISSPYRSIKTDLSLDKAIAKELIISDDPMPDAPSHVPSQPTSNSHPHNDAPPKGEKSVKRQKMSKSSKSTRSSSSKQPTKDCNTSASEQPQQQDFDAWVEILVIDEDEVIPKDETIKLLSEFQSVDKRVPTIFDHKRMEARIKDMLSNQFRDAEEYAYHLEQAQDYMENQIEKKYVLSLHKFHATSFPEDDLEEKMIRWITEVVRITSDKQYGLDFMEEIIVKRDNKKPDSFSLVDFKYLDKNDIEDLYYLCMNNKVDYQEKKIIDLVDIPKFCDTTLEKVLKEVKLKIFETEFKMKTPLLVHKFFQSYAKHVVAGEKIRGHSNARPFAITMQLQVLAGKIIKYGFIVKLGKDLKPCHEIP
ncbi:hypothetical protein Tco_0205841 [Tanacetum coccineum]